MATTGIAAASSSGAGSAALASAASSSNASSATKEIAGNFQDFLLLLTTQLKNQSPLDPLDTNQFTQQLVQFAGVEQQLKSNDTLNSMLSALKASSTANAASYVGMTVTADGSTAPLAGGSATWNLNAAKAAAKATITVKDAKGTTVFSKNQALTAGAQPFAWNGKDAAGNALPDGSYTVAVKAADAAGQAVWVSTEISGTVSAVDVSGSAPVLTVGGASVPLATVKTIAQR